MSGRIGEWNQKGATGTVTQRRHHYEVAFEDFLRSRRIPYVAVDEAKKALLPIATHEAFVSPGTGTVKSFDFVLYGESTNLLVEIKGRRIATRPRSGAPQRVTDSLRLHRAPARSAFQNWVTRDDVESLRTWERLFGSGFEAVFVFVYWCDEQPPDALFHEVFENRGKWYALRSVTVGEYARAMKPRSERWRTVHIPTRVFEQISRPFAPGTEPAATEMYRGPMMDVPDDAVLVPYPCRSLPFSVPAEGRTNVRAERAGRVWGS
ncbi:MAG: HYExAFE family protein [Phycisphaerae bacterium]|nr:HYExAFE family protein [Phycisphaerae bacterium]